MLDELPSIDAIDRELTRRSFREYVPLAWGVVEPSTPFRPGRHIDAMCEHLQALADGHIQNLLINVPPGHMKSLLVSVFFPSWLWGAAGHADWRMIYASYAMDLAVRDSMKTRSVIESDWYQRVYEPDWELCDDNNSKRGFANTASGFRQCVGVGGQSTGHRGDILAVDDPLNAKEQMSEAARAEVLFWWDQAFANRLNNLTTGKRIIIMQRLHEKDLSGHVMDREPGRWVHLRLPTLFEPENKCSTIIGWKDWRETTGQLLFPEMFPVDVVDSEKRRLGSMGFAGQHQQRPSPDEGIKFKRAWFRYFKDEPGVYVLHLANGQTRRILKSECRKFATCDTAFSTKQTADYTVIGIWAVTPENDLLLLEIRRDRMEDPDVERAIRAVILNEVAPYVAVERKQNGATLFQRLIRDGLSIRALEADTDKLTRATLASIDMENGKVYFLADAPWLVDYERELLMFPNAAHDDQVDVTSYAAIEKGQSITIDIPTDGVYAAADFPTNTLG